jgi:predicted DCC family thiol-disulfide oxidoreductase YuxK
MKKLPDPDESPGSDVVIFDGQCRFCQGQVRNLRRLDWGGKRLSFLSLHIPGTAALWRWAYHQVAARRYRIAGQTPCDQDACAVHFGTQAKR